MSHKNIFGFVALLLFVLAGYMLIGDSVHEMAWSKRLKAAAGFLIWGTGFFWGYLRERKIERSDRLKSIPPAQ